MGVGTNGSFTCDAIQGKNAKRDYQIASIRSRWVNMRIVPLPWSAVMGLWLSFLWRNVLIGVAIGCALVLIASLFHLQLDDPNILNLIACTASIVASAIAIRQAIQIHLRSLMSYAQKEESSE
jgi:hypothetical protein